MSEYIERGRLLELETFLQDADGFECSAVLSVDIRSAKAADVVEVKHGRWVEKDCVSKSNRGRVIHYVTNKCSVCVGNGTADIRTITAPTAERRWTERVRTNEH